MIWLWMSRTFLGKLLDVKHTFDRKKRFLWSICHTLDRVVASFDQFLDITCSCKSGNFEMMNCPRKAAHFCQGCVSYLVICLTKCQKIAARKGPCRVISTWDTRDTLRGTLGTLCVGHLGHSGISHGTLGTLPWDTTETYLRYFRVISTCNKITLECHRGVTRV